MLALVPGCSVLLEYPAAAREDAVDVCHDSRDEDLDGLIDCADPECADFCALPVLTPCPAGWRARVEASGLTTCDPWPETGYRDDCALDQAHFPGGAGCERIGTECPADGWPANLPTDRSIVYVDDDAAMGGDGSSREQAYRFIADATILAPAGALIAVAMGDYDERVVIIDGETVRGACVDGTRLTQRSASGDPTVELRGEGSGLANLSIVDATHGGVFVGPLGTATTIEDVVVSGVTEFGVIVQAGVLSARGLVVRDVVPGTDGLSGPALQVTRGGRATVERAALERCAQGAISAQPDSYLALEDASVRRIYGDAATGTVEGASIVLTRVVVEATESNYGLLARGVGANLIARDFVLRGTRLRDSDRAAGVVLGDGAYLSLERALLEDNDGMGLEAEAAVIDARDVVVRGTHASAVLASANGGISLRGGARMRVERGLVERALGVGVFVSRSTMDATWLTVRDTLPLDGDGSLGMGIWAQRGADLRMSRVLVERAHTVGVAALFGAHIIATELTVRDVQPAPCVGGCPDMAGLGVGLWADDGALFTVAEFALEDLAVCAVVVGRATPASASMDLTSGTITDTPTFGCVQGDGYDTMRLMHDVTLAGVGMSVAVTDLPLPAAIN